jgi:toxin CptA
MLLIGAGLVFSSMIFLTPLPQWLRLAILGLIATNVLYFSLRDALLVLPWSYIALKINSKNELQLVQKNGNLLEVSVKKNTVVTPYLTVVNCQLKDYKFLQGLLGKSVVILPDTAEAEVYRQLRVYLRWAKPQIG